MSSARAGGLPFNAASNHRLQLSLPGRDDGDGLERGLGIPSLKPQGRDPRQGLRSSGTFVITAGSNDKINFKESGGGAERTGTVAAGTYTSTTLAAAIKAAMEGAAGATGTYTVSYSLLTGKWTIASSLAFLSLLSNTGTNVATSVWSSIGFSVLSDLTGAVTYTGANIAIHTEEAVVFDLITTEAIDSFALLFDPLGGVQLTSSATLRLQANATNVWTAPSVDVALTLDTDFDAASYFFSSNQSYRFWRLKIVDPRNP
jgi:hypothetical protein